MNQDVQFTEMLLKLCTLHKKQSEVENESLSICISFSTKLGVNYVLFGLPYSDNPTVLIARNDNSDDNTYPNGVLFMDGYWFGADSKEYTSVTSELESQFLELNTTHLAEKLDCLVSAGQLPQGLKLL